MPITPDIWCLHLITCLLGKGKQDVRGRPSAWCALGTPGTQLICTEFPSLQRRLSVLSALCLPSFSAPLSFSHSDFWENPAKQGFTPLLCNDIALSSSPAHFAVTLHCTSCHRTSCHPSFSLQCTRIAQLQPFTSSLSQP